MARKQRVSYAQAQLPFAGSARAIRDPLKREWQIVGMLASSVLVLAVLYGYTVVASIAHVSLREDAHQEARQLSAVRARLEGEYLAETRILTKSFALEKGFVEPQVRVFVTRDALSLGDAR